MSGSDTSDSEPAQGPVTQAPERGRKRSKKEQVWKKTVAKSRRNEGLEYVSRHTNKMVKKREIGTPCIDGCFDKVTQPGVECIFNTFWNLKDYEAQNCYIQNQTEVVHIKRKKTKAEVSRRTVTFNYFVTYNNVRQKVCKRGFLAIHGLGESRVSHAIHKLTHTSTPTRDMRGRHTPHNKIVGAQAERVKEHIRMLPSMSSHYTRAKAPERKYLESHLSIPALYDAYLEWMTEKHPEEAQCSFNYYSSTFTRNFNISFEPPKTDTCTNCELLDTRIKNESNVVEVAKIKQEKEKHLTEAKKATGYLKALRTDNDPEVRAVCVDLQQILPTPRLSAGAAYYKRKLWTYNLCIHDLKKNVSTMYIWDETQSKRGSIEVASCLKKWIDSEMEKEDFTKLVVVSDNCSGQNKNINLVMFYLRELHSARLSSIDHVYLVSGHSYMDCDRAFGVIEKKIRRVGNIYTPDHYCMVIHTAVANNYPVIRMEQKDFLDFSAMEKFITKRKAPGSIFKDARKIIFRLAYREGYLLKADYEGDNNIIEVRLQKGLRDKWSKAKFDLSAVPLLPKYTAPLQLRDGKVNDLEYLMNLIPQDSQVFYRKIVDAHNSGAAHLVDDPDDPGDEDNLLEYH